MIRRTSRTVRLLWARTARRHSIHECARTSPPVVLIRGPASIAHASPCSRHRGGHACRSSIHRHRAAGPHPFGRGQGRPDLRVSSEITQRRTPPFRSQGRPRHAHGSRQFARRAFQPVRSRESSRQSACAVNRTTRPRTRTSDDDSTVDLATLRHATLSATVGMFHVKRPTTRARVSVRSAISRDLRPRPRRQASSPPS